MEVGVGVMAVAPINRKMLHINKRNPSRHRIEEHDMLNWLKANRKVMNKEAKSIFYLTFLGGMKEISYICSEI